MIVCLLFSYLGLSFLSFTFASLLLGGLFLLFDDRGDKVGGLNKAAVFGMVLTDGSDFLFFSEDLDGFSGKRTKISYLLHIDLQFFRDNRGG